MRALLLILLLGLPFSRASAGIISYLPLNGSVVDASANAFTWTNSGGTPFATVAGYPCMGPFDGAGLNAAYAGASASAAFNSAKSSYALEGWFYRSTSPHAGTVVMWNGGGNSACSGLSTCYGYAEVYNRTVAWELMDPVLNVCNDRRGSTPGIGVWYHAAWVYDSGMASMYVNGVRQYGPTAANAQTGTRTYISVGGNTSNPVYDWPGYIRDFVVWDAAPYTGDTYIPYVTRGPNSIYQIIPIQIPIPQWQVR